ncbi:uncharacterized protein LOC127705047 isoform X1 [Mytilus californianus]|uniref:uncharacterized protein LOC127705047 isoform X1 n=2 Tax=Mytilus californianus TaxID=6549 RepID=UPI002246FC19|nr:uncharacterized protein LOC127705047 isoform X1 [Mytilus californianus]
MIFSCIMASSMATCTPVCAVCDLRHQTSTSTHWCIQCEEPLCSGCREHHNVSKATGNHQTIFISDYQLLPAVVTDIKHHCVYHSEMYQLYCINHDSPICNKCVKDHGNCGKIVSLDDRVRDIKTSESFIDLEQNIEDLLTYINLIRKDRESDIDSITDQKKKISAQVCHLKKQVIQHINKLEEEFIKELNQIEFTCCDTVRSIVSSLQDQTKKINQMKSEIKNTKKYASDLQAFLCMREIQAKTTEYEKHLQSSIENKNHNKINIESATNTKIQDILMVDQFGFIEVKKSQSTDINLNRRKERQAQMMIPKEVVLINNVKLVFKRKVHQTCIYPTGCCVTKKGEFLFTDFKDTNGRVKAVNAESGVEYTIQLQKPYRAFDLAILDETTVAVSTRHLSKKPGISIVDLIKKKVKKFIDLPGDPYGITYDGKSLICCVLDKDLHVISCSDYSITTIANTVSSQLSYVSTHADKMFFTNPDTQKVTCCSYSGANIWEFKDKNILDGPQGITVDNNRNVFVVGDNTCNVVVISPDGKQFKQILTKEDGLNRPTTLFFDEVGKQLLVANGTYFANVYDISYF